MDILLSDYQAIQFHGSLNYYKLTCCMENSVGLDWLAFTLFSSEYISDSLMFQISLYTQRQN